MIYCDPRTETPQDIQGNWPFGAQVWDGKLAGAAAACQRLSAAVEDQWPALLDEEKPRDPQVSRNSDAAQCAAVNSLYILRQRFRHAACCHSWTALPCIQSRSVHKGAVYIASIASTLQALAADLETTSALAASASAAQEAAAAMLKDALLLQDEEYTRSLQLQVCRATAPPVACVPPPPHHMDAW